MRAVIPTEEVADRLVASAGNRLMKYQCPAGDGWHVSRPNVEHTSLLDNN